MEECCKQTLKKEWEEIHRWKPTLHWCPDWDYLLIQKGQAEFECCGCFQTEAKDEGSVEG